MTAVPETAGVLQCTDHQERRALLGAHEALHGIDYVEVVTAPPADNQRVVEVHFIPKATPAGEASLDALLDDLDGRTESVSVHGGERVRGLRVLAVTRQADHLRIRVDRRGDFSTYWLELRHADLDPAYSGCALGFKAGCPTRFDCRPKLDCPEPVRRDPPIDYLVKDYASFRQALLDFLPALAPELPPPHVAGLSATLIELLAHVGDQLSYYQDAVANEAYLETARQRISVRRHARLVDYSMHDGLSARTVVHLRLRAAQPGDPPTTASLPAGLQVLTRLEAPLEGRTPPHPTVVRVAGPEALERAHAAADAVFETIEPIELSEPLNTIPLYAWDSRRCCLVRGATTVDLAADVAHVPGDASREEPWRLRRGRLLLLEEVRDPETGRRADADPAHRQVVRLTQVHLIEDPLHNLPLTRVVWNQEDALTFPLCVSAELPDGTFLPQVSVARGNLVLADHGILREEWHPQEPPWIAGPSPGFRVGERPLRIQLRRSPLGVRAPQPADGTTAAFRSLADPSPDTGHPWVTLLVGPTEADLLTWRARSSLLDADPFMANFVPEIDDEGRAHLRFGNDVYGMAPPEGSFIRATYRTGTGSQGMVGADALAHLIDARGLAPPVEEVRNPLPAWGGVDPEPAERVQRLAPEQFRAVPLRAVTAADYAAAALRHRDVAGAVARFRWTGSWLTVFLTVDPVGRSELSRPTAEAVREWVEQFTQTGYDVAVRPPRYVPLDLELDICVTEGHIREDVEAAVVEALTGDPPGARAFFHPDRFTLGQPLYLSALYAAVKAVDGVGSVAARRFSRQHDHDPAPEGRPVTAANVDRGYIDADELEVLRLDNDPNRPEQGVLTINAGGGT
jgi:hypothetical protein